MHGQGKSSSLRWLPRKIFAKELFSRCENCTGDSKLHNARQVLRRLPGLQTFVAPYFHRLMCAPINSEPPAHRRDSGDGFLDVIDGLLEIRDGSPDFLELRREVASLGLA